MALDLKSIKELRPAQCRVTPPFIDPLTVETKIVYIINILRVLRWLTK